MADEFIGRPALVTSLPTQRTISAPKVDWAEGFR